MAPRGPLRCQICKSQDSKYTCPSCRIPYCSVTCYKSHKSKPCLEVGDADAKLGEPTGISPIAQATLRSAPPAEDEEIPDAKPLRALTSLKWPYIPEESSFPDPLKRDDPKPLQLRHYHAIATSPEIRSALSSDPALPGLLRKLDKLRGQEREEALECVLGVTDNKGAQRGSSKREVTLDLGDLEHGAKSLRKFAEAVEHAVRGGNDGALGLDWVQDD